MRNSKTQAINPDLLRTEIFAKHIARITKGDYVNIEQFLAEQGVSYQTIYMIYGRKSITARNIKELEKIGINYKNILV